MEPRLDVSHFGKVAQRNLLHRTVLFGDFKDVTSQESTSSTAPFGFLDNYVRETPSSSSVAAVALSVRAEASSIDLRYGQAVLHGGAVDSNVEGRGSVLQSVRNLCHTGDVCQRLCQPVRRRIGGYPCRRCRRSRKTPLPVSIPYPSWRKRSSPRRGGSAQASSICFADSRAAGRVVGE